MLKPSYGDLMDVINNENSIDDKVTSSYAIVIAASKRARQLVDGATPYVGASTDKAVSIAINEINGGFVRVLPEASEPLYAPVSEKQRFTEAAVDFDEDEADYEAEDELDGEIDLSPDSFDDEEFDKELLENEYIDDSYSEDFSEDPDESDTI